MIDSGFFASMIWWILLFWLFVGPQLQYRRLTLMRQAIMRELERKGKPT